MTDAPSRRRVLPMAHAVLCVLCALAGAAAAPAAAQVLVQLHDAAVAIDPAVTAAQAQLRAAEERLVQARAAFGPTATLGINQSETRYREAPASDLRRFHGWQAQLQVTQPLIRTALVPGYDAAQAQLSQLEAALQQARSEAIVRIVEAGFEVLKARDAVAFVQAQQLAAQEQLASARRSFTVGTVSVIDVREAEAKIDTVNAQGIAARAELELRRQSLAEMVGADTPEWLERGLRGDRMPPLPAPSVLQWLTDALAQSPQLRQAQAALVAAEAEVRKAWQAHAPVMDLTYNYTRSQDNGTVTSFLPRRGDGSAVGLNFNLPLFASGATQSKVREAMALRDKAASDVDASRRAVQLSVRQAFTSTLSQTSLAQGLETANRSLEEALRANRRGYEVGMKVNTDVLDAQSKLFEARRDLSRARYDAWLNYFRLRDASGHLGVADVQLLDALLPVVQALAPRGRGRGSAQQP